MGFALRYINLLNPAFWTLTRYNRPTAFGGQTVLMAYKTIFLIFANRYLHPPIVKHNQDSLKARQPLQAGGRFLERAFVRNARGAIAALISKVKHHYKARTRARLLRRGRCVTSPANPLDDTLTR